MKRVVVTGVTAAAALAAIALCIVPGCTERGSASDLYVLEELETASRLVNPEERVGRLGIFTGNHSRHPYRMLGYRRLFETLAGDIGDRDRATSYLDVVLAAEKEEKVRGELWYARFAYLWDADRAAAVELAEDLCAGSEHYYRLFFYLALYLMDDEEQAGLAERCFVKAGELAPSGPERDQVLGEYGVFLEGAGRTDEALAFLQKAAAYPFARETLGRILWDRDEREAAIDAYLHLVARVPGARGRICLDSLYAIVYPGAGDLDERIMERRMADEMTVPDAHFVDIEGRAYRLGRFRGTPLALFVFSPT